MYPFLPLLPASEAMAVEFTITIEGEKQLSRRITRLAEAVTDFSPELKKSANFLRNFFGGEVFDTRGAVLGEPWAPRKKAYPWPILEKTGKMRRSFRAKAEKMRAEIWNAVDYFKFHQSRMPRRRLPRRIMMKLDETRKNEIIQIFHKGLWGRVKKH